MSLLAAVSLVGSLAAATPEPAVGPSAPGASAAGSVAAPDASSAPTPTPSSTSPARDEEARAAELRIAAVARAREGAFDDAAELFRRSHALLPSPRTLLGWAAADEGAGRKVVAYGRYQQVLEATVREPSLAPLVRAARARLKALDGQLAHLRFAMDRDATIAIDGAPVEAAARRDGLLLLPGRHRVTRRMGDVTVDDEIVLAPGERRTLRTSRLRSRRPTPRPAKPAPHRATSGAPAPSLPAAEEPRPVTLGLGIGGLVGLLTGGILFALAVDKQGRLEPGCQPGCSGDVTNAQRHEVLGYAFGGTGVALMGVAGVLWWRGNTTTPESQARPAAGSSVGVRLGPQGVELRGVF